MFRAPQASLRGSVASRWSGQQLPGEAVGAEAGAEEEEKGERRRERSVGPMMENVRACCDGEFSSFPLSLLLVFICVFSCDADWV